MKKPNLQYAEQPFFMHPLENVMKMPPIDGFSIDYRIVRRLRKFDTTVHFHEYFEIEFIFDGSGIHYLNGTSIPIGRGYFNLVTPKDFHTYHLSDKEEMKLFNIAFTNNNISKELLTRILDNPLTLQGTLNEETTFSIQHLFELLFREFQHPTEDFHFIQRALLDSIVSVVLEHLPKNDVIHVQRPKTVNEILLYIEKEFLNPSLSLTQMSDTIHKTQNYLGSIIKKYTGFSFNQYINHKRLNYAANLLKKGNLSIHEIAASSGFSSTSYFIKLFKNEYGVTPAEYRVNP